MLKSALTALLGKMDRRVSPYIPPLLLSKGEPPPAKTFPATLMAGHTGKKIDEVQLTFRNSGCQVLNGGVKKAVSSSASRRICQLPPALPHLETIAAGLSVLLSRTLRTKNYPLDVRAACSPEPPRRHAPRRVADFFTSCRPRPSSQHQMDRGYAGVPHRPRAPATETRRWRTTVLPIWKALTIDG